MPARTASTTPASTPDHAGATTSVNGADPQAVRGAVARHVFGADADANEVAVRETHISWLFLAGAHAFKLKKPIRLSFLDYSTPERRRRMCQEEVRLNTRLAPSIYRGVTAIRASDHGLALVDDAPGAVDYLVHMRRYDEHHTLAAAVKSGQADTTVLEPLAVRLVAFHADVPGCRRRDEPKSIERAIRANTGELLELLEDPRIAGRVRGLERFLTQFIAAEAPLLQTRVEDGCVREVHGDLRAEHVVLEPTLEVVDCVEFDPDLRTVDVIDDLAFLVMDLCARGAERIARQLIDCYRRAGGKLGDERLLWFYAAHRALVRAKVALLNRTPGGQADDTVADLRQLLETAERCAWRARGRLVLAICGVPASGKSRLSDELAARVGARVLRSDEVRKRLAGLPASRRAPAGMYQPAVSEWIYTELADLAVSLLGTPGPVIVDATFRRREDRDAFAAGLPARTSVCFVQCVCPEAVLRSRADARDRDPRRISDADAGIVQALSRSFAPLDEIAARSHLPIRTDRDPQAATDDLLALLDQRVANGR